MMMMMISHQVTKL